MSKYTSKHFETLRLDHINSFLKDFVPAYKDHAEKQNFVQDQLGNIENMISSVHNSDSNLNVDFFEVRKIRVKKIGRTYAEAIDLYCSDKQEKQVKLFEFVAQLRAMYDLKDLIIKKYQKKTKRSKADKSNRPTTKAGTKKIEMANKISPYTDGRKVLMLYYLIESAAQKNDAISLKTDKTDIARFMDVIVSGEPFKGDIRNSNIYKKIKSLYGKPEEANSKDLKFIESEFAKLGLTEIVKSIQKESKAKSKKTQELGTTPHRPPQ